MSDLNEEMNKVKLLHKSNEKKESDPCCPHKVFHGLKKKKKTKKLFTPSAKPQKKSFGKRRRSRG